MENWLCKAYTVWQILYDTASYLQQYLQRYNYLLTSELHAFGCRWQMCVFFNFIVGGLRIKIRVATVSHEKQIHLCVLRVLCGEKEALNK